MFLAWQVTFYLFASLHGHKIAFWDTLSMIWLMLVDDVPMFEADADPLDGIQCPLHFIQRHRPIKGTK